CNAGYDQYNGKIYIISGDVTNTVCTNKTQVYDMANDSWETKADFPEAVKGPGAAVVDGKIYAFGGYRRSDSTMNTAIYCYDIANDSWSTKSATWDDAFDNPAIQVKNGKIYIWGNAGQEKVYKYDPVTDTLTEIGSLPDPAADDVAYCTYNDELYVAGGEGGSGPTTSMRKKDLSQVISCDLDWSVSQGDFSLTDGTLYTSSNPGRCYKANSEAEIGARYKTRVATADSSYDIWIDILATGNYTDEAGNTGYFVKRYGDGHTMIARQDVGSGTKLLDVYGLSADANWHVIEVTRDSGGKISYYEDDEFKNSVTDTTHSSTVNFIIGGSNGCYYDWVLVRQHSSPEPAATLGAEESAPADTSFTVTLPAGYTYARFDLSGIAGGVAHDSSGNSNDGTIYGAKWVGDGLYFDGTDDYVDCGNNDLGITTQVTQIAWVKFDEVARGGGIENRQVIVRLGGDGTMIYQPQDTPARISATAYDGTNWNDISIGSGTITADTLYMVANVINCDTHTHTLHLGDTSVSGSVGDTITDTTMIKLGGTTYPLHGTIAEVRIYNRALNESEIQDIYYNNSIPRDGLVGEWLFDHGPSTQLNVTPDGQNSTIPFYNVTNTGNVSLDVRLALNQTVSGITLKADTDNTPTGAQEVNTTLSTIYENLAPDNSVNIWLWSDFDRPSPQTINKTLEINVTQ
ncbi:hypothetical protein DRN85_07840, partial [Methanosarcinales archaeon]